MLLGNQTYQVASFLAVILLLTFFNLTSVRSLQGLLLLI
jgi:hypothetical protein